MQRHGGFVVVVLGLLLLVAIAPGMASCSSSSGGAGISANCSINSDCNSPLICAFARCHEACAESRDCPDGERCILSGTTGSCQLPEEATCTSTPCSTGQVCGTDMQCRAECTPMSGGCVMGDYCLPSGPVDACYSPTNASDEPALIAAHILGADGAVTGDGSVGTGPAADGAVSPESGSVDGAPVDSAGPEGSTGNACPSAQTQFGNTAFGDINPNFTSGVGARTAQQLLVFDSYVGPDPAGDGGGPSIGLTYVQAFDPGTGMSAAPAQPLFQLKDLQVPGDDGLNTFQFQSSAIAPTGEIALIEYVRFYAPGLYDEGYALYASFLGPAADAGAGVQLKQSVLIETAAIVGQPHVFWSNASQAFVMSWIYQSSGNYVKIKKFLADGRAAGGDSDVVPTDSADSEVFIDGNHEGGAVGASGNLFGVAYHSAAVPERPELSVLDAVGDLVGSPAAIAPTGNPLWVAVAGTANGFVYFYDYNGVTEAFLPTAVDAGVVGALASETADASTFVGFSFPGTTHAYAARAVADDLGGIGGVGLALLYPDGVSFGYVNADGVSHQGPNSVLAHTYEGGDYTSMTNLAGSFVLSLYIAANHQTQIAASGCSP
jgi:hypothetical protein